LNKKVVMFISVLVFLVGLTTLNLWSMGSSDNGETTGQLTAEKQALEEEVTSLIEELERTQPEAIAAEREAIIEVAEGFVQLAYNRTFEDYEEERAIARSIMNDELFERFFPADTLEANEHIETDVTLHHLYLEDKEPTADRLYAIADFHHIIDDTEIDRQEERDLYVAITIDKQEDESWIVTDLHTITSEVTEND